MVIMPAMAEAVVAGVVALIVALLTSVGAYFVQRAGLRQQLRTEFMAEQALISLLEHPKWTLRSFEEIAQRVGGFDGNALRQLLVRVGALRFKGRDGTELWGLRRRNPERLEGSD